MPYLMVQFSHHRYPVIEAQSPAICESTCPALCATWRMQKPSNKSSTILYFFVFAFVKRHESSDLWIVQPFQLEDLYVARLTDACGT